MGTVLVFALLGGEMLQAGTLALRERAQVSDAVKDFCPKKDSASETRSYEVL